VKVTVIGSSEVAKCGGVARIKVPAHPDGAGVLQKATAEDAYSASFDDGVRVATMDQHKRHIITVGQSRSD
jgi:predicted nucleic acid-binding protein